MKTSGLVWERRSSTNSTTMFRRIVENPRQFPCLEETVHRALLRHFPYGAYFVIGDESVYVLAVLHLHRHPEIWKSRN